MITLLVETPIVYLFFRKRKEKGMTQTALADKLNISNRTVSKWEHGDGFPDITILPKLAQALSVSTDELLKGEKSDNTVRFLR